MCSNDEKFIKKLKIDKSKVIDTDLLEGFVYEGKAYYSKNDLNGHEEKIKYNTGYKMGKR